MRIENDPISQQQSRDEAFKVESSPGLSVIRFISPYNDDRLTSLSSDASESS